MTDWRNRLDRKGVLVADGAWGTELSKHGLKPGVCPELWNADRPDEVRGVARDYAKAGADIILTNTFGGSRFKLEKSELSGRVAELNKLGAQLSKQAAGEALVFASVGPTGEFMAPLGTRSEQDMLECFAEQIRALIEGGADGIVVESMADLGEAKCALRAAKDAADIPVAVTMTFDKGQRGYATMMGVTPEQAATELESAGADIVGSNCGAGIENMIEIARIMKPATSLPLWTKANAGLPQLEDGKTVFKETPQQTAEQAPALVQAGAQIVGGCCGTTPEHIRAIAEEIRQNTP